MGSMTKFWTTAAGEKIAIADMTTEHIQNAISYLERMAGNYRDTPPPESQGDMGQYYLDQEWHAMQDKSDAELAGDLYPAYNSLVKELARRQAV